MGQSLRSIADDIIAWGDEHPRAMPWNETTDPYKIWISEIILQQTQVSQGIPYYKRFIHRFPTVRHLAEASEDEVLRLWQGLGYNSRAGNLHQAAQTIVSEHGGRFPSAYADILALKGVGEYTAAAISSFAFDLPTPVLDSNVVRILSRMYGISGLSTDPATRREMYRILDVMITDKNPGVFNQAMMNFGATLCSARKPGCGDCPVAQHCVALKDGLVDVLPVRPVRVKRKTRFFHYLVLHDSKGIILRRRDSSDIWPNMYEFPAVEGTSWRKPPALTALMTRCRVARATEISAETRLSQTLTHQIVCCRFYRIEVRQTGRRDPGDGLRFVLFENLEKFALPKVIRSYLDEIGIKI